MARRKTKIVLVTFRCAIILSEETDTLPPAIGTMKIGDAMFDGLEAHVRKLIDPSHQIKVVSLEDGHTNVKLYSPRKKG